MLEFKLLFLFLVFSLYGNSQPKLVALNENYTIEKGLNWIPDATGNILFYKANNLFKAQKGQLPTFTQSIRSTGEITQLLPINAFKTILFSGDQQQLCILDNTFSPNGDCIDLEDFEVQNAKLCAVSARPNLIYIFDEFNSTLLLVDFIELKVRQSVLNVAALIGRELNIIELKEHNNQLFALNKDGSVLVFDMFLNLKGQLNTTMNALNFWNDYTVELKGNVLEFSSLKNSKISFTIQCDEASALSVHGNSFYFSENGALSTYELKSQ